MVLRPQTVQLQGVVLNTEDGVALGLSLVAVCMHIHPGDCSQKPSVTGSALHQRPTIRMPECVATVSQPTPLTWERWWDTQNNAT